MYQISKVEQVDDSNVFIYNCISCGYFEIWDIKKRKQILKKQGGMNFINVSVKKREMIVGILISIAIISISFMLIFFLDLEGKLKIEPGLEVIHFLPFDTFNVSAAFVMLAAIGLFFLFVVGLSNVVLYIIDKKISLLEFNFKLHDLFYENHLYFLEFHSKNEKTSFGASLKRSIFGSMLVLGIGILVIENFLTIKSLQPYFFIAAGITLLCIAITLPFIMIFLYVSPLITKETNLYYYNKNDRVVKNVGSWLENSLQFFAVIDILLTFVIMLDSDLDQSWFVLIFALVLLLFSLFFVFTITFNRFYHSRLKEKFRAYIMGTYQIPIRKIGTFQQHYYCWNCGKETDYVQLDSCSNCGAEIHKCCICNEIIDIDKPVRQDNHQKKTQKAVFDSLIGKMETRMSVGPGTELPYIECPHCHSMAHIDEFLSWLRMRKTCPVCKTKLEYEDIIG